jgi:hypothetical protein
MGLEPNPPPHRSLLGPRRSALPNAPNLLVPHAPNLPRRPRHKQPPAPHRAREQPHDLAIWEHTDVAQNAVDEICARIPYDFDFDDPRRRKPHVRPRVVPEAKISYLYHALFEYPLLFELWCGRYRRLFSRGIQRQDGSVRGTVVCSGRGGRSRRV